eukprot:CAMPEP_0118935380 /NCGR_PEP_ID=MMETSP1169-20130426/15571_1 /TAXON_ID=36882 /ORGANISM="Pyramimonas obovata, Strain CCMP722" /LENGTH=312 /DNA_ID=CAMNT_0006878405 /DNA_START=253 /DNA_END=1191 /DNA_ORIENTATION=+
MCIVRGVSCRAQRRDARSTPPRDQRNSVPAVNSLRAPTSVRLRDTSVSSMSDETADSTGEEKFNLGTLLAILPPMGLGILLTLAVLLKEPIHHSLEGFSAYLDTLGPYGYITYIAVYIVLELLAIPAIPLTMTAGALFGVVPGTVAASIGATIAATGSFVAARYFLRERVLNWASDNPKFAAIDEAIGREGFRIVALLRLSPLLPFAISNYLYGLTSVKLRPYVLGSWLGMLPGTFLYVQAGTTGRALLNSTAGAAEASGDGFWGLAAGLGVSLLTAAYVSRVANEAVAGIGAPNEDEDAATDTDTDTDKKP